MPFPKNYGALGASFTISRILQAVCLIAILGMTANFIGEINAVDQVPPQVLVGTLSVVCIAVLYVVISYILYFDSMLPFLVSTGADSLFLIALIVVAVTVGKPLSYLDCPALPNDGVTAAFLDSALANLSKINYWVWAGAAKTTCYELKAVWGFSIALCVLFAFSSIISACLWKKQKMFVKKDIEGF
ncbi:membrane-associating domain-containing protein [Rutstroemia sp. NJR-2017a BBW]|nr:membrane-associating domain-containing protein [Rutstroemia sp. NJR-2017a BBW]